MKKLSKGFTLVELLVVIGILGILMGALFPAITSAMLSANLSACSMRGRNLYVGIVGANTEREAAGLDNVWPHTQPKVEDSEDIAGIAITTAAKYFEELFDIKNYGKKEWNPYVSGVDIGVLSGAGVTPFAGSTTLNGDNVAWIVAANVTSEMDDVIPVLITRNVDYGKLATDTYDGKSSTEVGVGKANGGESDTPFSNKAFVLIRKSGAAQSIKARYSRMNVIYNKQGFDISAADPKLEYLKTGAK